jgi:hypothetical protein
LQVLNDSHANCTCSTGKLLHLPCDHPLVSLAAPSPRRPILQVGLLSAIVPLYVVVCICQG